VSLPTRPVAEGEDLGETKVRITAYLTGRTERRARAHPSQWVRTHPPWRKQPTAPSRVRAGLPVAGWAENAFATIGPHGAAAGETTGATGGDR
jgi:hypothetical protein